MPVPLLDVVVGGVFFEVQNFVGVFVHI
jgi:hypothetical protein